MSASSSSAQFDVPFSLNSAKLQPIVPLFQQHGFVRIDGVFSANEIAQMKAAMDAIVAGFDPNQHPRTTFNTLDEQKHVSDRYFLESADKIRFFYEEDAIDQKSGKLLVPKEQALNKVGHALHWLNPTFRHFTFHERIKKIVSLLGAERPHVMQSMQIFKQPKIAGAVNEHVDSTFLHTKHPDSLLGVWIALDSARLDNGCLWFLPGSHRDADLVSQTSKYKFVRNPIAVNDAAKNNGNTEPLVKFVGIRPSFESDKFVPVECESGSLVIIHGNVVHKSECNQSDRPRKAYTFHLVDLNDREQGEWAETNWLQPTDTYKFPDLFQN